MISFNSCQINHVKIYVKRTKSGFAVKCLNSLSGTESIVTVTNKVLNLQSDWIWACYDQDQSCGGRSREGNVFIRELPKSCKKIPPYLREDTSNQCEVDKQYVSFAMPGGILYIYHPNSGGRKYNINPDQGESADIRAQNNINHITLSFDMPPMQVVKKTTSTQTRKHYALKRSKDKNTSVVYSIEPLFQLYGSIQLDKQNQTEEFYCESQISQSCFKISFVECGTQTDSSSGYDMENEISLSKGKQEDIYLFDVNKNCSESSFYPLINTPYSRSSSNTFTTFDSHSLFERSPSYVKENFDFCNTVTNLSNRIISPSTSFDRSIEYFSNECDGDSNESVKSGIKTASLITLYNNIPNYTISLSSQHIHKEPTMENLSEKFEDDKEFSHKSVPRKSCRESGLGQNTGSQQSEEMFMYGYASSSPSPSNIVHPKPKVKYHPLKTKLTRSNVSYRHISALLTNSKEYHSQKLAVDNGNGTIATHLACNYMDNKPRSPNFHESLQNHTTTSFPFSSAINPNITTRSLISPEADPNVKVTEPMTFLCDCCGMLNLATEATSHKCGKSKNDRYLKNKDGIWEGTNNYLNNLSSANIVNTDYKSNEGVRNSLIFYNETFAASSPTLIDSRPMKLIVSYNKITKSDLITRVNQFNKTIPRGRCFYNSKVNKIWVEEQGIVTRKNYNDDYYKEFMAITSFHGACSISKRTFTKSCQNNNLNQNSGELFEKNAKLVCFEGKGPSAKSWVDFRVTSRTTKSTDSEFRIENTRVTQVNGLYSNVPTITLKNELSESLIEMSKTYNSLNMINGSLEFQKLNFSLSSTLHIVPSSSEAVLLQETLNPNESQLIWENNFEHEKIASLDGLSNHLGIKVIEKDTQQISPITNNRFLGYVANKRLMFRSFKRIPQIFNKKQLITGKIPKLSLVNITKISSKNIEHDQNEINNQASSNMGKLITKMHSTEMKAPIIDLKTFSKELSKNKLLLRGNKHLKMKIINKKARFWKRKFWNTNDKGFLS